MEAALKLISIEGQAFLVNPSLVQGVQGPGNDDHVEYDGPYGYLRHESDEFYFRGDPDTVALAVVKLRSAILLGRRYAVARRVWTPEAANKIELFANGGVSLPL